MAAFAAFASGLVFGIGLLVSGMANPAKVQGFLDLAGAWDPSLAFVMAGAVAVSLVAFAIARRRTTTLLAAPLALPSSRTIDARLVAGSALFGVGWGIAGFCPGPALTDLAIGGAKVAWLVAAMLAGMAVFEALEARRRTPVAKLQE
jgi:uncharacterized protein